MDMTKKGRNARLALHLTHPEAGSEVRDLLREFRSVDGVTRVAPLTRLSRVLLIEFDPDAVAAETLVEHARRRWRAVQRVGIRSCA